MGLVSKRGTLQSGIWKVMGLSEEKDEATGHACLQGPARQRRQLCYDPTGMCSVQQHDVHLLESPAKVCS